MTNEQKIIDFLDNHNQSYDYDQLSELLNINPRQQVYQICKRLEQQGKIRLSKRGARSFAKGISAHIMVPQSSDTESESFYVECAYVRACRDSISVFHHDKCQYISCGRDKRGYHTLQGKREDYVNCRDCGGNGLKQPGILDMDINVPCSGCKGLGLVRK